MNTPEFARKREWAALTAAFLILITPLAARALPLGSVVNHGEIRCPFMGEYSAATGAACYSLTVSCPDTADIGARVAIANSSAKRGSITMMGAGPGQIFFTDLFANKYVELGYQTAQIAFSAPWEDSGPGAGSILKAACRPATVFDWIDKNFHPRSRSAPFCMQGYSAGGAAIAYALTHYGLKSEIDAAMLTAGPPFGDLYKGCTGGGPVPIAACGPGAETYFRFPHNGGGSMLDRWEHTSTCSNNPTPLDEAIWRSSSIDSPGADFSYPQTKISSFQCLGNEAPGQGLFFFDQLAPSTISATHCARGGSPMDPSGCQREAYWLNFDGSVNQSRFDQMITQMQTDCVARH